MDTIIQSQRCREVDGQATRDIAFTVAQGEAQVAKDALKAIINEIGFRDVAIDNAIAKVSIVGSGMFGTPGIAAKLFKALAQAQINIQMIATSEIKVSCVVAEDDGIKALKVIHETFGLAGNTKIQPES